MSNIANKNASNKTFNSIITTLSWTDLYKKMNDNIPISATNALIFSIPRSENGEEDLIGEGSIWLTDENGNLYPMTKPIGNSQF